MRLNLFQLPFLLPLALAVLCSGSAIRAQTPDPRLETVSHPGAVISMPVDGTPDAPAVPPRIGTGTGGSAVTGNGTTQGGVTGGTAGGGTTAPVGVGAAATLGVWVQAVTKDRRPQLQIIWIEAESPAQGRLQIGDYLQAIDQKPLTDIAGAGALLGARAEGANVSVVVQRGKQQQAISVPLAKPVALAERTVAIIGDFNGEWFKGRFLAFLQPVRRTCYGTMAGGGVIKLEGNFAGTWDPNSGAIQTQFDGKVKMLLRVGIKGTVNGQVDRNGRGSGTYTGTGPIGEEKGNWICVPAPVELVGGL